MMHNVRNLALALSASAALALAGAGAAGASTSSHHGGPNATTGCQATFNCFSVEAANPVLNLAVTNHPAQYAPLTFKTPNQTNASEDWIVFTQAPGTDSFMYAPNGNNSGLCVAETNDASSIVLKTCGFQKEQEWVPKAGSFGTAWVSSRPNALVITDPGGGPAYTRATVAAYSDSQDQEFFFTYA